MTVVIFALFIGVLAGLWMAKQSVDGLGWLVVTLPLAAAVIGLPVALLFSLAESMPITGWASHWKTGLVAPVPMWALLLLNFRKDRRRRRHAVVKPLPSRLLIPFLLAAAASQLLVPLWWFAQWVAGA